MSRDIFVQDLPNGIDALADIPDGWMPQPLPFDADGVRAAVLALAPHADSRTRRGAPSCCQGQTSK